MEIAISIIVPVYNSARYLHRCIDSLVNQTLREIEIILVDDCSSDNSKEIIAEYKKKYPQIIQSIYLEKNIKQGGARNRGIEVAAGMFLMFVDSDDFIKIDSCEKLYKAAIAERADIVFGDFRVDNKLDFYYVAHVRNYYMGQIDSEKRKAFILNSFSVQCGMIINRMLVVKHSLYFPENMQYEDLATTLLYYMYADRTARVEDDLYRYIINDNSTSTAKNGLQHFQQSKAAMILYDNMLRRGFYNEYRAELEYFLIINMLCLPVEKMLIQFDNPPFEYLRETITRFMELCPDYKKNIYFKTMLPQRYKRLLQFVNVSLEDAVKNKCLWENVTNDDIKDFYIKRSDKIKDLLEYIKKFSMPAIWGLGIQGSAFMAAIGAELPDDVILIDRDASKIYGQKRAYEYDSLTIPPDFIIITSNKYFFEIKNMIKAKGGNVPVMNLDIYLNNELRFPLESFLE